MILRELSKRTRYKILQRIFYNSDKTERAEPLVDAHSSRGETLLHEVLGQIAIEDLARSEIKPILKLLIKDGANIEEDYKGETPLHRTVRYGEKTFMTFLLQRGANIDGLRKSDNITPLAAAILLPYPQNEDRAKFIFDRVKFLLENGANVEACYYYNAEAASLLTMTETPKSTALSLAAERGYQDIVDLLLKHGANKDAMREDGATPLHLAAMNNHIGVVQSLLSAGANTDPFNPVKPDQITPLILAAENGHNGVISLLLAAGAKINATHSFEKRTALYLACGSKKWSTAKLLLEHGADPNMGHLSTGLTPLHLSACHGDIETTQLLISHNADLTAKAVRSTSGQWPKQTPREMTNPKNTALMEIFNRAENFQKAAGSALEGSSLTLQLEPELLGASSTSSSSSSSPFSSDDEPFEPSAKRFRR
jgi:ankyrin repeat protein